MGDLNGSCGIVEENLELHCKIKRLVEQRGALQQEVSDLTKKLDDGGCTHCGKVSFRDVGVQTEAKRSSSRSSSFHFKKPGKEEADSDVLKINKIIEMHSQLLKHYDKEVQLNMDYADTISDLNVRLADCEKRLREVKEKNFELERDLILWKVRRKGQLPEDSMSNDSVLRDVVRERNNLAKENKTIKRELKSIDLSFFDEIEDLKFSLKQSVELNKNYENSLRKMCEQFGVPFLPLG